MGWRELQPQTLEERLIHWTIVSTWGLWLLGALYVVGPVLGYALLGLVIARGLGIYGDPLDWSRLTLSVFLWCVGMLLMLVALIVAHLDFELGMAQTIKSSIGWAKGWALFAVYVLAGAMLNIRASIVYRATGIMAAQTLLLAPFFLMASFVGLPKLLYVSPLQFVGGPGPEFFDVTLHAVDDVTGAARWRFFSPWATAAAFLAGISFVFALYERWRMLQVIGVLSALVVCVMAGSRTSVVAIPAIVVFVLLVSNIRQPLVLATLAVVSVVAIVFADDIMMAFQDIDEAFRSARAASSRVRAKLANIAYHRWWTEAPIFGHGVLEKGPWIVQYMMIGSHHTWHGLLFVKGAVGFGALAVPLAYSAAVLALKAQTDRVARAGLGVLLAVVLFSFGDNLEICSYLIWPGLVVVGIALARRMRSPLTGYLGAPIAPRAYA